MLRHDALKDLARQGGPSTDGVCCPRCGCHTFVNVLGERWCPNGGGIDVAACAWGCDGSVHWPDGQAAATVVEVEPAAPATAAEERTPEVKAALDLGREAQFALALSGNLGLWMRYLERIPGDCCIVCFCTDDNACEGGCSWVDVPPQLHQLGAAIPDGPVCSACAKRLDGVVKVNEVVRAVAELRSVPWLSPEEITEVFGGEVAS